MLLSILTAAVSSLTPQNQYALIDPSSAEPLVIATDAVETTLDGEKRTTTYTATDDGSRQTETYETAPNGAPRRYSFEDLSNGEKIDVKDAGELWVMTYRASADAVERSERISKTPRVLPGKAIPSLILDQWSTLQAGKTVKFDLLVPQHLTTYGFEVRRVTVESRPTFTVEASNWFIRRFAPKILFVFDDHSPHRVIRYKGPAAVQIRGEKHRNIEIAFPVSEEPTKTAPAS